MNAPTNVHRYACPCGELVLDVVGPSWKAWDLAAARVEEHAKTCTRAGERWTVVAWDAITPAPRKRRRRRAATR